MRSKKAVYNIISSLCLQAVLIIVNLLLPRFIVASYGSGVNGLISSVTQFLGYIALLEGGIGGVIKAVLYKALVRRDKRELSVIMASMQKFFRKICVGLVLYVIALCFVYPMLVAKEFNVTFVISMIIILSLNIFMRYFFGISQQILLQSDQKTYVVNISKIITYFFSTVVMIGMIINGVDIRLVELTSIIILAVSPLSYYFYVRRHYDIDYAVKSNKKVIAQRWDGFAHQISAFIHANTDIALLTIFSSMPEVSVYSVYALIASGLKSILGTLTDGVAAAFGNLHANNEKQKMAKHFGMFDYFNIVTTFFVFALAGVLIAPFVQLYIDATDVNYFRPIFGAILVMSEAIYCLRCSYSNIIFVVGDFKQTKKHGYTEAAINLALSLILIRPLGLAGIAIGTAAGMAYRWIVSMMYVHNKIIELDVRKLIKKYAVNIFAIILFVIIFMNIVDYTRIVTITDVIVYAVLGGILLLPIMIISNLLICRSEFSEMCKTYGGLIFKKIRGKRYEKN